MKKIIFATVLAIVAFPALAQAPSSRPRLPIDPLGLNDRATTPSQGVGSDLLKALDEKLLPDLQYAQKLALASGSKVTEPCFTAWIAIIQTRQKAVTNTDGSEIPLPTPHLITDFEKLVELRNALQPDSDFNLKCSPVASMIRKDVMGLMGLVISGGAGLAALGL